MNETFRLRKSIKYQGMAFTIAYLAITLAYCSLFFVKEAEKQGFKSGHSAAALGVMGTVVFGTMLLMSVYIWTAYYVERFTINGTLLTIRSMLQNRQFDVSELESVKWRVYPRSGSILFRVLGSKSRLDLHGYSKPDRLRIIQALRLLVPSHCQENWPLFCFKLALPLRDGTCPVAQLVPATELYVITRRRYDRAFAVALPLSIVLALGAGIFFSLWQFSVLPVLVVGSWLLLRYDTPPEGKAEARLTSTLQGRAQLVSWATVILSLLAMAGALAGLKKAAACQLGLGILIPAFPLIIFMLFKADQRQRAADKMAAEFAVIEWQREGGAAVGPILPRSPSC